MIQVLVVMLALLLVVALICAWLLFPQFGAGIAALWRRVGAARSGRRQRHRVVTPAAPGSARQGLGATISATSGALARHRWVLLLALLLLTVPPLVILLTRQNVILDEFQGQDMSESGSMIAQLLRGERLTPPPPPPPELFTTAEIRRERPEIVSADRKWDRIDSELQQRVLAIFEVMRRQHGYQMVLVEGYRSPERQAELMSGGKATRAGAWQSCHQYGLAVDSAPIRDGKLQWNMEDAWTRRGYQIYGELAQQAGLEWGGSWRSIKDYVHVEMAPACRAARAAKRAELAQG